MASINKVMAEIRKSKPRSAWGQGVKTYAIELLDEVKEYKGGSFDLNTDNYRKIILRGADDWKHFSYSAMTLFYNEDIARRLSNKTELKLTKNGLRRPNSREEWLDTQARALHQADGLIREAIVAVNVAEKKKTVKKTVRRK